MNKQRGKYSLMSVTPEWKKPHLFHFSRFLQPSYNENNIEMTISKLLHEKIEVERGRKRDKSV